VNEVSCETLNIIQGEEEMKNALIGGLIVLLMSGLLVSCPEKPEEEKDKGNSHNGLTVAEEYRGDWWSTYRNDPNDPVEIAFQLTSSEYIVWVSGSKGSTRPAWTVDNEGTVELHYYYGTDTKYGTFSDNSTFVRPSGTTYVKK
jgi:hypothetical protein